jgi:hypothetical protein
VSDDEASRVRARPTLAERRAAERSWLKAGGAFYLDSSLYPTPAEWAHSHPTD